MPHWKKMMDPKDTLAACDLNGQDVTLEIAAVVGGEIVGESARKSKKPIASFKGTEKKLVLNVTNCKTIVQLYGSNETNDWIGKRITLFGTTTSFGGETKECIRIRPVLPPPPGKGAKGKTITEQVAEQMDATSEPAA